MILCLKTLANQALPLQANLCVEDRLPPNIETTCTIHCSVVVKACGSYYQMTLDSDGIVPVVCQRCLGAFNYTYQQKTTLAVCRDELLAAELMSRFDGVISDKAPINLLDVITDDLHLNVPEKHEDEKMCHCLR